MRADVARQRVEGEATERVLRELRTDIAGIHADATASMADAERDRTERKAVPATRATATALRNPVERHRRAVQLLDNAAGKVGGITTGGTPEGQALISALIAEYESNDATGSNPAIEDALAKLARYSKLPAERARMLTRRASAAAASAQDASPDPDAAPVDRSKQITELLDLARSLVDAGSLDDAITRVDEAVAMARNQPEAKRTSWLTSTLTARARILSDAGRDIEAEPSLREAYELSNQPGRGSAKGAEQAVRLGFALLRMDRAADAEPILRAVVSEVDEAGTDYDGSTAVAARCLLAIALHSLGREREAQTAEFGMRDVLTFNRAVYGEHNQPEYRFYLERRGRIDLVERSYWSDINVAPDSRKLARARDVVTQLVAALERSGSTADGRLEMYQRWLTRVEQTERTAGAGGPR